MKHIISFLIDSMYVDVPLGRSKVCIGPNTLQCTVDDGTTEGAKKP